MSFDGVLLTKLIKEFEFLKSGRISKIVESGDTDFIFTIRSNRQNSNLIMSFSSDFSRIHLTNKNYDSPANPKSFTMFLRKHIEGYFIEDIKNYHCDRIIYFKLAGYNEMQDYTEKFLICEIMGRYSNLVLTDKNFTIIEALKHDGIGEFNRTILPNATYTFPDNNKLNPFDYTKEELKKIATENNLKDPKDYMNTFNGVSLNLAYPIFEADSHVDLFYEYLHLDSKPATFINFKEKFDFYYHPFNYEVKETYESISSLLDNFYYKQDILAKIKLKTNDLLSFVSKQISKNEKKIIKLNEEMSQSTKADNLSLYGELLLSASNLKEKKKEIIVLNYYTNEEVRIPLDPKLTIIENSNKYYKKYQKAKNAITYINEQLEIAKQEIEYFTLLKFQLAQAGLKEALEIQDELIQAKYLFHKDVTKGKKLKPKPLTYELDNGTLISVGKNNIQNDYLTNHLAKPNEMWFHVKNAPGSHVVVHKSEELNEEEIRSAAYLASYYSTYSDSSSVAVDYTKVRNIKKIPGRKNCFVTYTHQRTIYIDPDINKINQMKVKK